MTKVREARRQRLPSPAISDDGDEVEKYHSARDLLSLEMKDQACDSEDGSPADAVLDVSDDEDSVDESLGEDGEELERDAHFIKLARQAKVLEAKLRIARGEADGGDESDEDTGAKNVPLSSAGWGGDKHSYYNADAAHVEVLDDQEALLDEEAEAMKLQHAYAAVLCDGDFGDDNREEQSGEEEGGGEGAGNVGTVHGSVTLRAVTVARDATVEAIPRGSDAEGREARAVAVRQDVLELNTLVQELRGVLGEVRGRLGPLLGQISSGEMATAEGASYLEAKHTLLLHYAASIVFYLLLKAEGRTVRDHPVVERLVEVRTYLEKVRPIDKRLHYQVEKLLTAARRAQHTGADAVAELDDRGDGAVLCYAPRPDALVPQAAGARVAAGSKEVGGAYCPLRFNPVAMELNNGRAVNSAHVRRAELQSTRRAARSSLVAELAAEVAGAPEEQRTGAELGLEASAMLRDRRRLAARSAVEEELMVRVPLSKEERKQLKGQRRAGLSGKALLDDFADGVAELVGGVGAEVHAGKDFRAHLAGQKFGLDLTAQTAVAARRTPRSGDADLSQHKTLADRQGEWDEARAQQVLMHRLVTGDGNDGVRPAVSIKLDGKRSRRDGHEDEFYREAADAAADKRTCRRQAHFFPKIAPPAPHQSTQGARGINATIENNRGLTPHRRKNMKNPRKKHRVKFAEATVRRKGQVQAMRQGEGTSYGGESTGIKARVSKSVKL